MQYPQIQFYRGSLVRLASGQLKQIEELNSDDFLESAKLARSSYIDSSVVKDFLEVGPSNSAVLIKFFLESSRQVVFIELPIERPFFVYHRGWSSWNPQKTYDKFGLKCRKLKIGDTCISLIDTPSSSSSISAATLASPHHHHNHHHQPNKQTHNHLGNLNQESHQQLLNDSHDQCKILFSSIRINE